MLSLSHSHAVTRHDNHALGRLEDQRHFVSLGTGDLTGVDLIGIDGLSALGHFSKQHIAQRAIHGNAHDIGQNQSRGAHQRTGNNQYCIAEDKARQRGGNS